MSIQIYLVANTTFELTLKFDPWESLCKSVEFFVLMALGKTLLTFYQSFGIVSKVASNVCSQRKQNFNHPIDRSNHTIKFKKSVLRPLLAAFSDITRFWHVSEDSSGTIGNFNKEYFWKKLKYHQTKFFEQYGLLEKVTAAFS